MAGVLVFCEVQNGKIVAPNTRPFLEQVIRVSLFVSRDGADDNEGEPHREGLGCRQSAGSPQRPP